MKNQSDGKVTDNTSFTIAINIFPSVVNTKKNSCFFVYCSKKGNQKTKKALGYKKPQGLLTF